MPSWRCGEGADAATRCRPCCGGLSQVERVSRSIEAAGAAVRYRRVRSALAELRALAVRAGDARLAEFLSADEPSSR